MGQESPTVHWKIEQEVFAMLPIAIQLYSVRDDAAADMRGTLQKIKEMISSMDAAFKREGLKLPGTLKNGRIRWLLRS